MTSNIEFQRCPFCNGEATCVEVDTSCWEIGCKNCDFRIMSGPVGIGWFADRMSAAKFWNTRAALAVPKPFGWILLDDGQCTFSKEKPATEVIEYWTEIHVAPAPSASMFSIDDTLRIDWLDAQEHIHAHQWQHGPRGTPIKTSFYDRNYVLIAEGISLRHAIDAAMQAQGSV